jgi:8-amino-7-oxononanoate synthase
MSLDDEARARLDALDRAGLLRTPAVVSSRQGPTVRVDGREVVCLCANNYLGLADHPALRDALREAVDEAGAGAGASRLISGTMSAHRAAEHALARFVDRPAALLFSTGYAANLGTLPALYGADDVLFSDALNHASLIDGCRLSRARVHIFPHRDTDALARLLAAHRSDGRRAAILVESVFSMDGDESDLRSLRCLADAHEADLYVDEAHALGVFGRHGAGLCAEAAVVPDVLIGTLGKAFGLSGAFVAASEPVIRLLENRARSYVFSSAPQPALAAATVTATALVRDADDARAAVLAHAERLRRGLGALGFHVPGGRSAILPLRIGDPVETVALARELFARGVFVQAIRPPTVPLGSSRLRVVPMATHTAAHLTHALDSFASLARP